MTITNFLTEVTQNLGNSRRIDELLQSRPEYRAAILSNCPEKIKAMYPNVAYYNNEVEVTKF